jgi:hypothetical protein
MKKILKRLKKWWHSNNKEIKKMSADKRYAILMIMCR